MPIPRPDRADPVRLRVVELAGRLAAVDVRYRTTETPPPESDCHPAYEPCLPNLPGDALNCGHLTAQQRPVRVKQIGVDPFRFDRDGDGRGCTS